MVEGWRHVDAIIHHPQQQQCIGVTTPTLAPMTLRGSERADSAISLPLPDSCIEHPSLPQMATDVALEHPQPWPLSV
jgi:hypothetical protein